MKHKAKTHVVREFNKIRARMIPLAQAQGIYTDKDIERRMKDHQAIEKAMARMRGLKRSDGIPVSRLFNRIRKSRKSH